jgi:hypothetical protein
MSKTTIVCAWVLALAACASGTSNDGGGSGAADASVVRYDASASQLVDAASSHTDAGMSHDAATQTVDAGSGSGGLFCTTNSQCTNAGECCVTLGGPNGFCGPGTVLAGQCFPVN